MYSCRCSRNKVGYAVLRNLSLWTNQVSLKLLGGHMQVLLPRNGHRRLCPKMLIRIEVQGADTNLIQIILVQHLHLGATLHKMEIGADKRAKSYHISLENVGDERVCIERWPSVHAC